MRRGYKLIVIILLLLGTFALIRHARYVQFVKSQNANKRTIEEFVELIKFGRHTVAQFKYSNPRTFQTKVVTDEDINGAIGPAACAVLFRELTDTHKHNNNIEIVGNKEVIVNGIIDDGKSTPLGFEETYTFKNGMLIYFECRNNIPINK